MTSVVVTIRNDESVLRKMSLICTVNSLAAFNCVKLWIFHCYTAMQLFYCCLCYLDWQAVL